MEYQRLNDQGLINQGWKDSWDGINFADGTLAEPPTVLCEVQAYVYDAYMARAWIAYDTGHGSVWPHDNAVIAAASYRDLRISNAPMAGGRVTIDIANSAPTVRGLPEGMVFQRGHRP